MSYKIECPQCGKIGRVPTEGGGPRKVRCSNCNMVLDVPAPEPPSQNALTSPHSQPAPSPLPPPLENNTTRGARLPFAIKSALFLSVLTISVSALLWYSFDSSTTRDGVDDSILVAHPTIVDPDAPPQFHAGDFNATRKWLVSKLANLASVRQERNDIAYRKALDSTQDVFSEIIGQEVAWSLPVAGVTPDHVVLQSEWNNNQIRLEVVS